MEIKLIKESGHITYMCHQHLKQFIKPGVSTKFLDDERFSPYGKLAPSSKADFAFVQHMVYHMANGDSRIAVLLPHGVLFRGAAEETIRKYLIKELNVIDAIIGLPAGCFQGASIPVCCIGIHKRVDRQSWVGGRVFEAVDCPDA